MANTKERIVQAAIDQFAEKGYTEASMRTIAEKVDIKPASIYNYFSSKAEILELIMTRYTDHVAENVVDLDQLDELIETQSAEEILKKMFFQFHPDEAKTYLKMLKIMFQEQFREPVATDFVKNYLFRQGYRRIKTVLDKLAEAGKIKPVDTGIYATILVSLINAAAMESVFYSMEEYRKMKRISHTQAIDCVIEQLTQGY